MSKLDKLRAARRGGDFNLSFLDIMACGLGAIILIFLLVKHNVDRGSVESEALMQQLESLEQEVQKLRTVVADTTELNAEEERLGDSLAERKVSAQIALAAVDDRLTRQQQTNAQLQQANDATTKEIAQDIIASPAGGEEQYLLGLRVEGQRIAILLDHSGSMTDEKLVDVFSFKVGTEQERRRAPKWQRAKRATRWILNRVPRDSSAVVIGFSEQARVLGGNNWQDLQAPEQRKNLLTDLEGLTPGGATNLQGALQSLTSLSPRPTHVYLVTDGLPTKVDGRGPRCARGETITPQCRLNLFTDMLRSTQGILSRLRLNVVLLPLEGDWAAANAYWNLAIATGGLMISPPKSWP